MLQSLGLSHSERISRSLKSALIESPWRNRKAISRSKIRKERWFSSRDTHRWKP